MYQLYKKWIHYWTKSKSESGSAVCSFQLSRFDKMGICSVSVNQIKVIDSALVFFALQLFCVYVKSKREPWDCNKRRSYFQSLIDLIFLVGCVGKEFLDNCIKPINYYLTTLVLIQKGLILFCLQWLTKYQGRVALVPMKSNRYHHSFAIIDHLDIS